MFSEPNWKASIDFEQRIEAIPANASARGMFFQFLIEALGPRVALQIDAPTFIAFKSYPLRDYVRMLARGSKAAYPSLPAAEAVRRLGRLVYPNYAKTITGTALFAVAGHSFRRVVELCPRAYEIGMTPGKVKIISCEEGRAIVHLQDIWNVPEFHQVGVWEGGMDVCNVKGTIKTHIRNHGSCDLEVTWSAK